MTLLFVDGFDHYNTADITKKGWVTSGSPSIHTSDGFNGGGCCKLDYTEHIRYDVGDISGKRFTCGFAVYFDAMPNSAQRVFFRAQNDTGGSYVFIYAGSTGIIYVYNNGIPGLIYTSPDGFFTTDIWYYVELQIEFLNSSSGYIGMRWDEEVLIDRTADNVWTGGSNYNYFYIQSPSNGVMRVDNVYFLDEDGTKNNDYLGKCRIDTLYPDGAGNYSQMTPSAGSNYQCVDEAQLSESDYVTGNADGEKDSYGFGACPTLEVGRLWGVQTNIAAKEQGEIVKLSDLIRVSSSDYLGGFQELTSSNKFIKTVHETDPSDSNDWTEAKINAAEFGQEVDVSSTTTTTTSSSTTTTTV